MSATHLQDFLKKENRKLTTADIFSFRIFTAASVSTKYAARSVPGIPLEYDLNDILSKLTYTRILYPSSKLASNKQACLFLEQPSFELHDIYRALSVLTEENDFIQAELYKNSQKVVERRRDVLYYDCTNYYFELEEADDLRRYGKEQTASAFAPGRNGSFHGL